VSKQAERSAGCSELLGGVLKCLDLTIREGSGLLFTFAMR
jgi:hypothetical protein